MLTLLKDGTAFGLKEYELTGSSSKTEESIGVGEDDTPSSDESETGGEGGWIEVMNQKAKAQKEKRLKEQEERKTLREQEARAQRMGEHLDLQLTQYERAEYYRKQKEARLVG